MYVFAALYLRVIRMHNKRVRRNTIRTIRVTELQRGFVRRVGRTLILFSLSVQRVRHDR